MIDIKEEQCTGCEVCSSACPVNAISFFMKNGFRYPMVDIKKCINCGLCEKPCPAVNGEENNNETYAVYSAWTKEQERRLLSTSGGVCYELSKMIILEGGYVAGVVWSKCFKDAKYEIINTMDGLSRISQTKYFQPKMNGIYEKIKKLLINGEKVLYIGTACTNSGLRKFLGKEYSNLICCDFICRGYTSQMYHEKRVDYLENKYNSKIKSIQYKNKDKGWKAFGTKFWFDNGESYYVNRYQDPYELLFKKDDFNTRPSCYSCKYRSLPRLSDITVGDFWGIQNVAPEELEYGISAVIISSKKGKATFDLIKDKLICKESSISEITKGNYALLNQLNRKEGAEQFFVDLENLPFFELNEKYVPKVENFRAKIKRILKDIIKCNLFTFVYYNFLCSSVKRKKHSFIFPFWGTRIDLSKGSQLLLNNNLYLNIPKHKHSKEEMYLRILKGGCLEINGVCKFGANNTIEINENARFSVGRLTSNYGTTIICGNNITFGNDIGIGRNVTIYDNNFHSTGLNRNVKMKPLIIEDHVWLCTGVTIAKGIKIEYGAVCSINSTVTRNIKSKNMVAGNPAKVVMTNVEW